MARKASSTPERGFLERLFEMSRTAASTWLDAHYDALGDRSTVDIRRLFQGDGYEQEPKG